MNKKICVLEDSEEILDMVTLVLEAEGYEVYGYNTVASFRSSIDKINPAACLLDVMLPDGNGIDVCEILKLTRATRDLPVILMTANLHIDKMKLRSRADDFIAKPFDINDLTNRISVQLNARLAN